MKYWQIPLVISAVPSASLALAEDFKTTNGKEYKNAEVSRVEPDGIVLKTKSGISKVYFTELPKEVQERFHYDPEKAASYSTGQNAATLKNNEESAKELAGMQWTREQQQNTQALQTRLQLLQNLKENLQREIEEKEKLPKRQHGYANPARADLPALKDRLFNVNREIGETTKQLQQLEHGY